MDEYEPTRESLGAHPVPDWFHDAKLGIFIHWGVYSVPAWAPTDADIGGDHASPYAEWYPYYMYDEESPTHEYHLEHYGGDVDYEDFVADWHAENWDPAEWADLFADVGARYVVLTGEHHDGFPLWECDYTPYNAAELGPGHDLVGDLCEAVRDRGLRFAPSYHAGYNYYQAGFDGPDGHPDFDIGHPFDDDAGPGPEYVDFMNAKHRELVRKYDPDFLWFDVPMDDCEHLEAMDLIADFYNQAGERGKEVVVNDRAATDASESEKGGASEGEPVVGDFATPEYDSYDEVQGHKWEACRGIGHSFGYNRAEDDGDHLTPGELVRTFVDVVSKNGNLLLNVGPRADGTIPELQRERLDALGNWLDVNGEAIFSTRPWTTAEDDASDVPVRYTWGDGRLYATAFEWPGEMLSLGALEGRVNPGAEFEAELLTASEVVPCDATETSDGIRIAMPDEPDHDHAFVLRLSDVANERPH